MSRDQITFGPEACRLSGALTFRSRSCFQAKYKYKIITITSQPKWHVLLTPCFKSDNSDLTRKWLMWDMRTPPWQHSAWPSAKRWPTRARPSPCLSTLVQTSPSPGTPRAWRPCPAGPRRRPAHPLWEETRGAGRSSWKRSPRLFR